MRPAETEAEAETDDSSGTSAPADIDAFAGVCSDFVFCFALAASYAFAGVFGFVLVLFTVFSLTASAETGVFAALFSEPDALFSAVCLIFAFLLVFSAGSAVVASAGTVCGEDTCFALSFRARSSSSEGRFLLR